MAKVIRPFQNADRPMWEAVSGAGYFQFTFNAGINTETGEVTVNFRDSDKELTATLGELMIREDFWVNTAPIGDTVAQLNLAFAFGYMARALEEEKARRSDG